MTRTQIDFTGMARAITEEIATIFAYREAPEVETAELIATKLTALYDAGLEEAARRLGLTRVSNTEGRWGSLRLDQSWDSLEEAISAVTLTSSPAA